MCVSLASPTTDVLFTTIHNTVNNKNLMTLPSIHLGFLCRENEDTNWGGQTQHTQQLSLSHSLHPSISRWWDGCVGDVSLLSRRRRGAQQGGIWFLSYYEEKTKPTEKTFLFMRSGEKRIIMRVYITEYTYISKYIYTNTQRESSIICNCVIILSYSRVSTTAYSAH